MSRSVRPLSFCTAPLAAVLILAACGDSPPAGSNPDIGGADDGSGSDIDGVTPIDADNNLDIRVPPDDSDTDGVPDTDTTIIDTGNDGSNDGGVDGQGDTDAGTDVDPGCDLSPCATTNECEEAYCDGAVCAVRPAVLGTTCEGDRVCDGAGACGACTDDSQCDDGAACTVDSCNVATGACEHTAEDSLCADDFYCNGVEVCSPDADGADGDGCVTTPLEALSDGVRCTVDSCDEALDSVTHTPEAARCDDDNECTADSCDAVAGCVNTILEGASCADESGVCGADGVCNDCVDDGDGVDTGCGGSLPVCVDGACAACEVNDDCPGALTCDAGQCVGCAEDTDCDDGVPCTLDVCDVETTVCTSQPMNATCSDNLYCTGVEVCLPSSARADADGCVVTAVPVLDDGVSCTVDRCDDSLAMVIHEPDNDACGEGTACSAPVCTSLGCELQPLDDGLECPDGYCADGACASCVDDTEGGVDLGCSAETPACVDGACTLCTEEGPGCPLDCAGVPGGASVEDACGTCDDDPTNDCLVCLGDDCGVCDPGSIGACDDGNPCTQDSCSDGACVNDPLPLNGASCVDDDVCTLSTVCDAGVCVAGRTRDCDSNPCHTGVCDPIDGCELAEAGTDCSDGDNNRVCSEEGACLAGCVPDENPCMLNSAQPRAGGGVTCVTEPATGYGCESDGDPCTVDVCDNSGVCTHDYNAEVCGECGELDCSGPCFTGECVEGTGCVLRPSGSMCDDGNSETAGDTCTDSGLCVGCPAAAPECGFWMPLADGTCTVDRSQTLFARNIADAQCVARYFDSDGCISTACLPDGTCSVDYMGSETSCDAPCGTGTCNGAGSCADAADACFDNATACYDSVCDETEGCIRSDYEDERCADDSLTCTPATGLCSGSGCGDGFCENNQRNCPSDCPASCHGSRHSCGTRYPLIDWRGTWRSHQSTAYGWRGTTAQQNQTITRMLDDRMRWLHLIVDYCQPGASTGPLCLCGADNSCIEDNVPLDDILAEIEAWMNANPNEVVTIYLDEYVSDVDFVDALDESALSARLYTRTSGYETYESWPLTIGEMANQQRTLVVFGAGILSKDNVLLATSLEYPEGYRPRPNSMTNYYDVYGDDFTEVEPVHNCADELGRTPEEIEGFHGLYALVHSRTENYVLTSWGGSACYNTSVDHHRSECREFGTPNAMLFTYYNSASAPSRYVGRDFQYVNIYQDRCNRDIASCARNDDCESGICGGFFVCLNCANNADCEESEWCDTYLGTCVPDLQDGSICFDDDACVSGQCDVLCNSCEEDSDCDEDQWCDIFGGCQDKAFNSFPCASGVECVSGVCNVGACTECNQQSHCPDPDEFCTLNPLAGQSVCAARKENGALCTAAFECAGGACYLGTCSECDELSDCASDEYCTLNLLPGVASVCADRFVAGEACGSNAECLSDVCSLFTCVDTCDESSDCPGGQWCDALGFCQNTKEVGAGCLNNEECALDNCFGGFCVICDEQDDCDGDEYCTLDPLPGESMCQEPKANGATCLQTYECASGNCFAGFCVGCDEQSDCVGDTFCSLDPLPGQSACIATKAIGAVCAQNFECSSGNCYLGFCVACNEQSDCTGGTFCSLDPNPGESACIAPKANGALCAQNFECASGNCWATVCSECNEQSDCGAGQYCNLDIIPPINSICVDTKANGSICGTSVECTSGQCTLGQCGECVDDGQCAANEHCDLSNNCAPDVGNNAPCIKNSACTTGICSAGFCAECTNDSHCPSNEFCDTGGDCAPDVGNNAVCTRNEVCSTGLCLEGFCAQCNGDTGTFGCPASQHCNAVNDCANDVGNNAPCLRNSFCTTGICSAGFCAECTNDSHCPSNEFCDTGGDCAPDVGNNAVCTRNAVCSTGLCLEGFCAQCNGDTGTFGCPSNQHCNAVNDCANDVGNNAPCLRNSFCTTDICSAGLCAECLSASDCTSSQFCGAGGDCINKYSNGTPCVNGTECSSGCCSFFFCANSGIGCN